jgi:hypothetical protein
VGIPAPGDMKARPQGARAGDLVGFGGSGGKGEGRCGHRAGVAAKGVTSALIGGGKGLLTLTAYEWAMCDRGNPCARRHESAPAGRAGRGSGAFRESVRRTGVGERRCGHRAGVAAKGVTSALIGGGKGLLTLARY